MSVTIGSIPIECPCGVQVDVPVSGELVTDDEGRQFLECESDMSDLWAHSFTHDKETPPSDE